MLGIQSTSSPSSGMWSFRFGCGQSVPQRTRSGNVSTRRLEPHPYHPGRLDLEQGLGAATGDALAALGHGVRWLPDLSVETAGVCTIVADRETGVLYGGADPRRSARAMGW